MPTYAYACTACGHRFEVQQSFTDASLTTCPECEGRLRKLFNSVGIVFKGSGFYRTDSRNGSSADSGAKDSRGNETSSPAKESTKESGKENGSSGKENGSSAKESSSASAKEGASSSSSKPATSAA